MITLDQTT